MKKILIILLLLSAYTVQGQSEIEESFRLAEKLADSGKLSEAYAIFEEIEARCDKTDTIYDYILWYYTDTARKLEQSARMSEKFDSSLFYGLKSLALIEKGKPLFGKNFEEREVWTHKNLIISYFGLDQPEKAKKHQLFLYQAYKTNKLPEGIDQFYNFNFFRWKNKNIWGYEWYPELGDPETEGSFSKIVYYVYSTNPDGTDKDQLYRLHVLKFHKIDESVPFDYVLTKRLEVAQGETSGTLYAYTYTKDIDYSKLQHDVREVLKGNYGKGKN